MPERTTVPIAPLPQFEADLAEHEAAEQDRLAYERLNAPKTIVIRHGIMKLVAELPYNGEAKPGCGSKIVATTTRGTELGEMLTSTCPNSGCAKSVSRKEMLEYIENSGGRNYPFSQSGRILRIATKEDIDAQAAIEADRSRIRSEVSRLAREHGHDFKVVEAEAILGGERLTVYVASEHRVEARAFTEAVEKHTQTRVTVRAIGARDEARITADYERCGQHCCCKNFLKVLKPVSMRSAKQQKATLEPLKISGRCGRLMCCLRYEDSTYQDLKKNLPNRKKHVGTPEGNGIVIDSQILTQLVLVELDGPARTRVAIPVENLTEPSDEAPATAEPTRTDRPRRDSQRDARREPKREPRRDDRRPSTPASSPDSGQAAGPAAPPTDQEGATEGEPRKKRRRRRKRSERGEAGPTGQSQTDQSSTDQTPSADGTPSNESTAGAPSSGPSAEGDGDAGGPTRKKRRRRRRRRGSGEGGGGESGGAGGTNPPTGSGPDTPSG